MDSFHNFQNQRFDPQIYESGNVPPSTDKLYSFSGYQAGLMTSNPIACQPHDLNSNRSQQPQHAFPQSTVHQQQQEAARALQQTSLQHPHIHSQQPPQTSSFIDFNSNNNNIPHQQQPQALPFIPSSANIGSSNNNNNNNVNSSPPTNTSLGESKRYSGMYASTGFDMISVLSRLVNRPNPQIDLGPVDLSCSFVVVDAKQYDLPVVYCSPMFERLTGYLPVDVIGRNCRFLQAPDGRVAIGSRRKYTDNSTVYHIKAHIVQGKESQSSFINYRKTGQPFVNLLTVIPITWDTGPSSTSMTDEIDYFVGLQVDLVDQPNCIFQNMKDGTYTVNYRHSMIPTSMPGLLHRSFDTEALLGEVKAVEEWRRPDSPQQQQPGSIVGNSNNMSSQQHPSTLISDDPHRHPIDDSNSSNNNVDILKQKQQRELLSASYTSPSSSSWQQQPLPHKMVNVETLIKEASIDEGRLKRCWHELLLDESPDFIHVLTIKGIFLYCSDSIKDVLKYKPSELVGQSLKKICHPADLTTVMRELKQSSHNQTEPVNLIYRARRKDAGYMWIECCGKLRHEDGRGRKYIVLSGRERPVYQLPKSLLTIAEHKIQQQQQQQGRSSHNSITMIQGAKDHGFWGKLSLDGLLLYVSWTCANILGSTPSEIIGTSMYQLMRSNRTTDLTRALAEVKEGKIVYLKHALLNGMGMEVMVATTFYPDGGVRYIYPKAMTDHNSKSDGNGNSDINSTAAASYDNQGNSSHGFLSEMERSTITEIQQPSFVLMHTKIVMEDEYSIDRDDEQQQQQQARTEEENMFLSIDPDLKKKGKVDQQNTHPSVKKMIDEVDVTNNTNWQYELHQLRITNKKLRSELGDLLKVAKQNGLERTTICSHCFRRLPGTSDLQQEDGINGNTSSSGSPTNDDDILCNICSLQQLHTSATEL